MTKGFPTLENKIYKQQQQQTFRESAQGENWLTAVGRMVHATRGEMETLASPGYTADAHLQHAC